MFSIPIPNVHVYEARSNYWSGEILKGVTGDDLYLTTERERSCNFKLHCDDNNDRYTVEFANGVQWDFSTYSNTLLRNELPRALKSTQPVKIRARACRIYSDSMFLTLMCDNTCCLRDLLLWKHPYSPRA